MTRARTRTRMNVNAASVVVHQALRDCGFIKLNHPAYSPDLGSSDYFVFRNPKFHLRGTRLTDAESLKVAVEAWFDRQNGKNFFSSCKQCRRKIEKNALMLQEKIVKNDSTVCVICCVTVL